MKIHFKIEYQTKWGQRLLISIDAPSSGSQTINMSYAHPGVWTGQVEINKADSESARYAYLLLDENAGTTTEEWDANRKLPNGASLAEHIFCFDTWNAPAAIENIFLTAPFQNVLLRDEHIVEPLKIPARYTHIFTVKAPFLQKNHVPCIIGDCKPFGNWTTHKPLLMQNTGEHWQVAVNLSKCSPEIHYKYGLFDPEDNTFCCFEDGQDRLVQVFNEKKTLVHQNDGFIRHHQHEWRGAGVGLPVFSIRTKKSFGVGDFHDLKLLIDWAARVGLKLIQVLPLNDTIGTHTEEDVLPYAAITAFALNPLFLHLPSLGNLPASHPLKKEYKMLQTNLNERELVAFLEVVNFKLRYAREMFLLKRDAFLKDKKFQKFFEDNQYWLVPYAAFCVLRDQYGTSDYRQWKEFTIYNAEKIADFTGPDQEHFDEVALNYYLQYHLHIQLLAAHEYANMKGVVLKGDIPIGVNRNSVDTWSHPEYFHIDRQAGAPPDMFAVKGQNWELPTYNWEAMKRNDFDWWKKRFAQMANYFDTFRVDHILGFFRIWQIPTDQIEGLMGHLYPSVPIHINEFHERGIRFDYNRFCKPYITDAILWEIFGDDAAWVKANCLQIEDGWVLRLKAPYTSQKQVELMYQQGDFSEKVKWGLYDLISNVLLFEEEGSHQTRFYPRFGLQSVTSFRELEPAVQAAIEALYVDYYFRRQDAFWYQSGMEKLPALKRATNMLICGEDLGLMTQCVTDVMKETGILSLEVQRMPKVNTIEFFHPGDAPYLSVVTPSTHDMSTVRGWWEEDRGVTQRFYNQQLGHWGEAPYFCEWWISRDILLQHLYSPAMWAVFQLQDLLGISPRLRREDPGEERINVPSNSRYSWRYRMHLTVEELLDADDFNDELRNFIVQSNR